MTAPEGDAAHGPMKLGEYRLQNTGLRHVTSLAPLPRKTPPTLNFKSGLAKTKCLAFYSFLLISRFLSSLGAFERSIPYPLFCGSAAQCAVWDYISFWTLIQKVVLIILLPFYSFTAMLINICVGNASYISTVRACMLI